MAPHQTTTKWRHNLKAHESDASARPLVYSFYLACGVACSAAGPCHGPVGCIGSCAAPKPCLPTAQIAGRSQARLCPSECMEARSRLGASGNNM